MNCSSKKFFLVSFVVFIMMAFCPSMIAQQRVTQTTSNAKVAWSKTTIDSTFNPTCCSNLTTTQIVAKYKPQVDALSAPIATCPTGLERGYPEAPLSNWAVDVLFDYARNYLDTTSRKDMKLDFAILNFGGMRTEMPVGNVSRLDIMSIFPFDNYLVIVELPGKSVKMLLDLFAKTRIQVMSNVKIKIENNQISQCLIGGEPFDENKSYNVATIDFLLNGGDGLYSLAYNDGVISTGVKMMDLITSYVLDLTKNNKVIEKNLDGRAVVDSLK